MKKEAESAKSLYEVLLQKLNETDIAASIRTNNVTLVERASVPRLAGAAQQAQHRAGPAWRSACCWASALVLGRDYLDNTVKDPEEMERYLHLDLLAAVPRYDESSSHLVTEAYQNLRTALLFARKGDAGPGGAGHRAPRPRKARPRRSSTSPSCWRPPASKTIVVDFDLRRSQLHSAPGADARAGPDQLLHAATRTLDALVRPTRTPNLFALTAGPLPPNPPALLARKDMADFLEQLRQQLRLDPARLAAARVGHGRAAAGPPRRPRRCSWCSTTRSTRS